MNGVGIAESPLPAARGAGSKSRRLSTVHGRRRSLFLLRESASRRVMMSVQRWIPGFVMATLLLTLASAAQGASTAFWFGAEDPVVQQDKHKNNPADYMDMFKADAPWSVGASHLAVFKISTQFATRASDADLAVLIADLHRRNIGVALEAGMLRNDRGCGKGEGYIPKSLLSRAMKRIQQAGGQLDFVSVDEVVFFGHERNWPDKQGPACHDSIEEVAREVADKAAEIHSIFPQAQIGAVEPITTGHGFNPSQLVKDYLAFADQYQTLTGSKLAFMHADIAWRMPGWQAGLAPLKAGLRARNIPFGIIFGGTPDQQDDLSWTRSGLNELESLASNPATVPGQVIIQSWQPLPTHVLPETTPGTGTWMLLQAEGLVK
jgi:hypothetical protein